jgi:5-methylcytosine-specific restriction endonuclease McrA
MTPQGHKRYVDQRVATRLGPVVDDTPANVWNMARPVAQAGPLAWLYLYDNMRKRTSAEPERFVLVMRRRLELIVDSICGLRFHQRTNALAAARFRCQNCSYYSINWNELALDHIIPRVRGGSDESHNRYVLCRSCNSSKHSMTLDEWEATGLAQRQRDERSMYAEHDLDVIYPTLAATTDKQGAVSYLQAHS